MDPFGIVSSVGNDATQSSTVDDDFDALFGPTGGSDQSDLEGLGVTDSIDDINIKQSACVGDSGAGGGESQGWQDVPSSLLSSSCQPTTKAETGQANKAVDDLLDFSGNDVIVVDTTGPVSTLDIARPVSPASVDRKSNTNAFFSLDNGDPGLDDFLAVHPSSPATATKSNAERTNTKESSQQQSNSPNNSKGVDLFGDIFSTPPLSLNAKTTGTTDNNNLDDIFGTTPPKSEHNFSEGTDNLVDIFADSVNQVNSNSGQNPCLYGDILKPSNTNTMNKNKDRFDDPFAMPSWSDTDSTDRKVNTSTDKLKREHDPFDPFSMAPPVKKPPSLLQESTAPQADLFVNLPDTTTSDNDTIDGYHQKDKTIEEQMEDGNTVRATVPDILDFLDDPGVQLPDLATLEEGSLSNAPVQTSGGEIASTTSSQDVDIEESTDDCVREGSDEDKVEVDEKDLDKHPILLTAPSTDMDLLSDAPKQENDGEENMDTDDSKAKESVNKGSEFLDFSLISIGENAHLNVDVSKDKRSLTKKGSLALRRKPSRRAIRTSGSEAEDALFKDSTEPKPVVLNDDDSDNEKTKDVKEDIFDDPPITSPKKKEGSQSKSLIGGVKIPGLLEGLKKAKPFSKQDKKDANTCDTKETEKDENKSKLFKDDVFSAPSKSLKNSQNENIAQTSVKPSDLKRPMAGSIKLPGLLKPLSPSDNAKPSSKPVPPVPAKPSLSNKQKLDPIKSQTTDSHVASAVIVEEENDKPSPSSLSKTPVTPPTTLNSSMLKNIPKTSPSSNIVLPSSISSSPKPFALPKPKLSPRPFTPPKPLPKAKPITPDTLSKPAANRQKEDEGKIGDNIVKLEGDEKTGLSESSVLSNMEVKKDDEKDITTTEDIPVVTRRKSSVSGVSSVQYPFGPDKAAPRKSSISGSAYAPMGFKSSVERSVSSEGSEKSRSNSTSSFEEISSNTSRSRTTSLLETTEDIEDNTDTKKDISTKPTKAVESEGDSKVLDVKDVETKKNIEGNEKQQVNGTATLVKDNKMDDTNKKPMWGVQLRKVERKPPPSMPVQRSSEPPNPINWRQQLTNKRSSFTPKEPVVKEVGTKVPEWARASEERRKRLMESGMIKPLSK